jgi:hypothetical protein
MGAIPNASRFFVLRRDRKTAGLYTQCEPYRKPCWRSASTAFVDPSPTFVEGVERADDAPASHIQRRRAHREYIPGIRSTPEYAFLELRSTRVLIGIFVAGRRLGAGLLFSTLLAANIGAGSIVAASGIGFADGPGAWWWVGSAGLGSLVLPFWVRSRLWREASRHGLQTVGDFLELRYGAPLRGIVASLL